MEEFITKHLKLIESEKEAEIEESRKLREGVSSKELEKQGLCLRRLKVGNRRTGLYGRTLVTFEPEWAGKQLPSHSLDPGDIVGVCPIGDFGHRELLLTGVIWSAKSSGLTVAFDNREEVHLIEDSVVYSLVKVANNVTYRRLKNVLQDLKHYRGGCAMPLISIFFEESKPSEPLSSLPNSLTENKFFNSSLDESQRSAVEFAMRQKEIAIIHGPPGTGKTTTLVEIIRQHIAQNLKVLVCAPSNVAVDNLVEKLAKHNENVVRLGHPARTVQTNHPFSLDALLVHCDNNSLMQDIRKDMDTILSNVGNMKDKGGKHKLYAEVKTLSRELKEREVASLKEVLTRASVILATLTSAHSDGPLKHLPPDFFHVVVIDECSQSLEVACWIPLLRASKCILAGDHLQLPPTIISKQAAKDGLSVTLMERVMNMSAGSSVVRMLTTQYRMHESIMHWPSRKLYDGKLVADSSVSQHLLRGLPNVDDNEDTSIPLLLIDTAGCNLYELESDDELSKGNEGEACLAAMHVDHLVKNGVLPEDIAVVAPYNLQVEMLRSLMSSHYPKLEIKSIDGFQGREKEAIIFTLTRSNDRGEVGFLAEDRRINVAITRARRHLTVICDSETVSHHLFLKEFVEYLTSEGEIRSAHQYQVEMSKYSLAPTFGQKKEKSVLKTTVTSSKSKVSAKNANQLEKVHAPTSESEKSVKPSTAENASPKRNEEIRSRFQEVLLKFKANEAAREYAFDPSLTAFERMVVHEIANKLDLCHISKGEGKARCIIVRKPQESKLEITMQKQQRKQDQSDPLESKSVQGKSCQAEIPKSDLMEDGDEQESSPIVEEKEPAIKSESKTSLKKKKKKPQQLSSQVENAAHVDDDNDVFDSFLVKDKSCHYPSCKTGTTVLGQVCEHCVTTYCLRHFLPEIHGCGDLARAHARQQLLNEEKIRTGSRSHVKKVDPVKRRQLERKLEKKLTDMGSQRTRKTTKK